MNTNYAFQILEKTLYVRRPHGGASTAVFCLWLIDQLPGCTVDAIGNIHLSVGTSHTLFCAHVDTVHQRSGTNKIIKENGCWRACQDVLGADDGAGVALLMHMINAGVPGHYLFTQGEEQGCIGSSFLVQSERDSFGQFDRAVAFDRKGTTSVITHQRGQRTCSDGFAKRLACDLNALGTGLSLRPDSAGVYTDTGEFEGLIAECTNISIGYWNAHSENEWLDLLHFETMCQAAVLLDWERLPTIRKPSGVCDEDEATTFGSGGTFVLDMTELEIFAKETL